MRIAVVSGGFDPIHSGHILYLNSASELGEKLIVALNSDEWLINKKGKSFMPFSERKKILENIKSVDEVISFQDDKAGSCIEGLKKIQKKYPKDCLIFCNGGDRTKENIPEMKLEGIEFAFSVGGEHKANSSSWILKEWAFPSEDRVWGKYYDLFKDENLKLKELIVSPRSGMSYQRHFKREEIWFVSKGNCQIRYSDGDSENYKEFTLSKHESFHVKNRAWHQISNPFNVPCHIIEIQYGAETDESDIERLYYYENN
tara:strand:+ start:1353 stop:2126 length:774 start_codon:yes stop_codon:yes gene_type:complete